jgi:hypothetical protein
VVLNGQVRFPGSQPSGQALSLYEVHLVMRFSPNDFAQLTDFEASFRGLKIRIDGEVTNFASMRNWKLPGRWQGTPLVAKPSQPAPAMDILDQLHLGQNARLNIQFSADGNDMNTLRAEVMLLEPDVETPWGSAEGLQLRAAAAHLLDPVKRPFMQARAFADRITTPWGTGANISLTAAFFPDSSTPFNASLNLAGEEVAGKWNSASGADWVRAKRFRWDGTAALAATNFSPVALDGRLRVTEAESRWGSVGALSVALKAGQADAPTPADATWGIWTWFSPYVCSCRIAATNIQSPQLRFDSLSVEAKWRAPQLAIEKLEARLYDGRLGGGADLDVQSREPRLHAATDFDPHRISQLLTPAAQSWLSEFAWSTPPAVNTQIRLVLPPWTNRGKDWLNDLRPTVEIAGDFSVGAASFRKLEVTSASARYSYTNRVWNVPRLAATRADGSISVDYTGDDVTHEFRVVLDSRLDPADAIPWLDPRQRRVLSELHFSSPPEIHAEARGFWHALKNTTVTGTVAASHFTVRGEPVDEARARVQYGNHLLRVSEIGISQGPGRLEIPLVSADLESKRIFLTNAQSTLDPQILLTEMGTNAPGFLNLVHFDVPPAVRASGSFVPGNPLATDMRFEIQGEHFHWTNLGADKISGAVQWVARNVILTNIQARLYNSGTLNGWLAFDSSPGRGDGFRCDFTAKDVDFGLLARGLTGQTNRVAGMLDGSMTLDAPDTAIKGTWAGNGYVHIHDALLWQIKIFGFLSPLLNAISPGAGDSRARQASALFTVGGGKVSTDDLEIRSTGVRLLYRGSVTMDKQIKGRVEADLLRDTPVFGPFLSAALSPLTKLFEYQITGSMRQPVFKPVYVPQFFIFMLRPFHTMKDLLLDAPANAPRKKDQ